MRVAELEHTVGAVSPAEDGVVEHQVQGRAQETLVARADRHAGVPRAAARRAATNREKEARY